MNLEPGDDTKKAVAAFLSRCTAAQRAAGLPPDGAKALRGAGGTVYTTVPEGLGEGDTFVVQGYHAGSSGDTTGHGADIRVTVPEGSRPGQVLHIAAAAGTREQQCPPLVTALGVRADGD